jgi:hypothetical protein
MHGFDGLFETDRDEQSVIVARWMKKSFQV